MQTTRCSYFEAMFSAGMRESAQREINMDGSDFTYVVLRKLIAYLYTLELDTEEEEEIAEPNKGDDDLMWLEECLQIMNAAESFQLPHLKHIAEQRAAKGISMSTVAPLLETGDLHALPGREGNG